jgi:hypothetical protein
MKCVLYSPVRDAAARAFIDGPYDLMLFPVLDLDRFTMTRNGVSHNRYWARGCFSVASLLVVSCGPG